MRVLAIEHLATTLVEFAAFSGLKRMKVDGLQELLVAWCSPFLSFLLGLASGLRPNFTGRLAATAILPGVWI